MSPILVAILRILHIFGAITWAGGSITMMHAIGPTAKALGDDAKSFMQYLNLKSPFATVMFAASGLTVLSGVLLYYNLFGDRIVFSSVNAAALTLGAIFGIGGWLIAYLMIKRSLDGLKAVSAEIAGGGGPPTPEQIAQIGSLQETAQKGGLIVTILVVFAMVGMSLFDVAF